MSEKTQSNPTNSNTAAPGVIVESIERLAKSAHSGIDNASQAVHPAIDRVASGAHKAIDNADEVALQAKQALDKASIKGEQLVAASSHFMREHPIFTLGLAVTAGYVLSRLLATR